MSQRVHRWQGAIAGTLALVTLGLLYAEPGLFAAALIPLAYVVVGSVARLSPTAAIELERSFEPTNPAPGDRVTVTLTVQNTGETALTDLRLIDGVPDTLAVVDASPRAAIALRAGDSHTVTYDIIAKRGDYAFDDPVVRLRGLSATRMQTTVVTPDGETTLSCARAVTDAPANRPSRYRVGTTPTDAGGSGVEFHSTREYRGGDPLSRLDWRRLAKTGELTTVQFREEQATNAVLVVDARPLNRVTPQPGHPNGASSSVYAGERLYNALTNANVETSVTAIGLDDADELPWASASSRTGTVAAATAVFDAAQQATETDEPGTAPTEPSAPTAATADGGTDEVTEELLVRLSPDVHVILVSPVLDAWPVTFARSLAVRDRDLLVLSPDVAPGDSPGQFVAGTHRDLRLHDIELTGAKTVDWTLDDPLALALTRSLRTLLSNT